MGIILISNDEKSGPFIKIQYPSLLCDVEEINPSELKRLYEEQKEKMLGPNYFETKIKKGVNLAFFYTGSSSTHYVGKPGNAILVFISEEEISNENLEGMMRRIAHELLPQSEEATFYALFQDYYDLLKNGELGPFWEEIGEKRGQYPEESIKIKNPSSSESTLKEIIPDHQNDEINSLKGVIEEQEKRFEFISEELADLNENNANLLNKLRLLKEEIKKKDEIIEDQIREILDLKQLNEQTQKDIEELKQDLEDTSELQKMAQTTNELTQMVQEKHEEIRILKEQLENIGQFRDEIELKNKEIVSIKTENEKLRSDCTLTEEEIGRLKNENERFLGTFTNLKLDNKQFKEKLEGQNKNNEKLKDEIIEMKKDIKVLRRERDHYKKIVKDNNFL